MSRHKLRVYRYFFVPHGDEFVFFSFFRSSFFASAGFTNAAASSGVLETEVIALSPLHPTPSWSNALRQPPEYMDICKLCCINRFFFSQFLSPSEHLGHVEYIMCVVCLTVKQREVICRKNWMFSYQLDVAGEKRLHFLRTVFQALLPAFKSRSQEVASITKCQCRVFKRLVSASLQK